VVIGAERLPHSWLLTPWTIQQVGESGAPAVPDATVRLQLIAEVDRLSLTAGAPGWLPLRAAAVALDGRCVVLVGDHRIGKTTLAFRLVRAGWHDVAAAVTFLEIDGPLGVQPYWRPFTVTPARTAPDAPQLLVPEVTPASTIGQLAAATPLAAVVVARPGDDLRPIERIGPAETMVD